MNRMHRVVVLWLIGLLMLGAMFPVSPAAVQGQDGSPIAADVDFDGVPDELDTCVDIENADQTDSDGDWLGDACDSTPNGDSDGDGVDEFADRCPGFDDAIDSNANGVPDGCDAAPTGIPTEVPIPATEFPSATATEVLTPTTTPSELVLAAEENSAVGNTPAGEWVWVELDGGFRVLFQTVIEGGTTSAASLTMDGLPELPDGNIQGPGPVVTITSTASWAGPAYVCGPFDRSLVRYMYDSSIYRFDGDSWVTVGQGLDENLHMVCGESGALGTFTVGRPPFDPGNTWVGENVDPNLDSLFRVRFDSVTSAGQTTAVDLDPASLPPLPADVDPNSVSVADIGTTAIWESAVYVCGPYDGQFESNLGIYSTFLLQDGTWVEIGNGLDQNYGAICGYSGSLGIFATARIFFEEETPVLTMSPVKTATSTATPSVAATATATGTPTTQPVHLLLDGMPESIVVAADETVRISASGPANQLFTAFKYEGEHCEGLPVDTATAIWFEERLINPETVTSTFSHSFRLRDPSSHTPIGACLFIRWIAWTPTATRTPLPSATPAQSPIASPTPTGAVRYLLLDGFAASVIVPADATVRLSATGGPNQLFSYARFEGESCAGTPEIFSGLIWTDQRLINPESVFGQYSLSYRLRDDATGELIGECRFIRWIARTPTPVLTQTGTVTPTSTEVASATGTATATVTDTATNTPTDTPTATETATDTPTATATPTESPTVTAQPSDTATSTASATASRTLTPSPVIFAIGTQLITLQEVRVRDEPRSSGQSIRLLGAGTSVTVTGTPVSDGPTVWYPVSFGNSGGWIEGRYLGPAPTPTASATATATRQSHYNYPAGTILVASQNTWLAQSPGGSKSKIPDVPMGTEVTVTGAPVAKNGREWLPVLVSFGNGSGWVDATHVQLGPLPTSTGTLPTVTRTPTRLPGQSLSTGDRVLVATATNLRDTPSPQGLIVMIAPKGATGYVTGLPVREGREFFYPVVLDGLPGGYLPQSALLRISASTTITPTRTPTATRTPARTQTPTRTPTRHPGNVFNPGSAVVVIGHTPTDLRAAPSSSAPVLGVVIAGQAGMVVGYAVRNGNAYFYPVQIDGYPVGYLASGVLQRADGMVSWQLTQSPIRSATATSTPVTEQWIVAATHLRNGPSASFSILAVLPKGSAITVTGEQIVDGAVIWARVRTAAGTIGWVPAVYLQATLPK